MTQNEHDKFSELFTNTLVDAHIEYATGAEGEAYVIYNDFGILFNIAFRTSSSKYVFGRTELFKSEYKKYGLSVDAVPDYEKVFETVAFTYKTRQFVKKIKQDVSLLYQELLIDSDIEFQVRYSFDRYMVINSGFPIYDIGYNPKTGQYGIKRHEIMKALYKACNIPLDKKPDFKSLYKRVKDTYMAQVAIENAQHLYDI